MVNEKDIRMTTTGTERHDTATLTGLTAKGIEFLAAMDSDRDRALQLTMGVVDSAEHTFNAGTDLMRFAAQKGLRV